MLPPPPVPVPPAITQAAASSSVSSSSEAMFQKRQETACAVAQMRERLRQMGILGKSSKIQKSAISEEESLTPSDSGMTLEEIDEESAVSGHAEDTHEDTQEVTLDTVPSSPPGGMEQEQEQEHFAPPLPPPAFVDDSQDEEEGKKEETDNNGDVDADVDDIDDDDDTASTVSVGSAVGNIDRCGLDDEAGGAKDLDAEEEEAMRLLLANLNDAREKAVRAYSSLLSKKNAALSSSSISTSTLQASGEKSSHHSFAESDSLAPPTLCASSPKSQKRSGGRGAPASSLDSLLSDFEHSFEVMTRSTTDILTQSANGSSSGLYRSSTLSKWRQSGGAHMSIPVLPTVSESFENVLNNNKDDGIGDQGSSSSSRFSHISGIDELVSPSTSQIFPNNSTSQQSLLSSSVNVEDSNSNIEAILEKYSDRLADMVSAKVMSAASTSQQK
jgi:hypothetical protein